MKVYKLTINTDINDESGLDFVSFVEYPATELNFLCFEKEEKPVKLEFDASKHIVKGIAMECDQPIYRNNAQFGEHYVVFDKDCIEKMMLKLSKTNLINSVDTQHNGEAVDGVYLIESFMIDRAKGVDPVEFKKVNDHSWVVAYKVENEQFWNEIIKNGSEFNGFSISGRFEYVNKFGFKKEDETFEQWISSYLC